MKQLNKKILLSSILATISLVAVASQITATVGISETPTTDFSTSNDSITDSKTGLVWQRCLVGQTFDGTVCTGTATTFTDFDSALSNTKDGWRLPTIKELSSLADHNVANPAINTQVHQFTNGIDFATNEKLALWSSTPIATPARSWGTPTYKSYAFKLSNGEPKATERGTGKAWGVEAKYVLLVKSS